MVLLKKHGYYRCLVTSAEQHSSQGFDRAVRNRTGPTSWCTRRRQSWTVVLCWTVLVVTTAVAQQQLTKISGVVADANGAAVANASVDFEANGNSIHTTTDVEGNFTLLSAQPYGMLSISSPGFNTVTIDLSKTDGPLRIRLEPAGVIERILVASDDERIPATPTSQFALSQKEIAMSGALTIDDVLRQAPGFSLFRRSGSLSANPTSQGVSLRGVGANGASRALVLVDGVPLNSPFGGWVYWNRLPRVSIENVQIYNGGT